MKCKKCGSNLDIDTAVCPYCGTENPVAKKHREDMERFEKDYRATKDEVIKNTGKFNQKAFKITAIAVTVAFLTLSILLVGFNNAIAYRVYRNRITASSGKYLNEIKALIEEENPLELARFVDGKNISVGYDRDTEGIRYAIYVARNYSELFRYVMDIAACKSPRYSDKTPGYMTEYLKYILSYSEEGLERDGELQHYFDAVYNDSVLLLRTYMNLSEEDGENLKSYSDGKLALVIEEAYNETVKE